MPRSTQLDPTLSLVIGLVAGSGMAGWGAWLTYTQSQATHWPSVTGRIVAAELESSAHKSRRSWYTRVSYVYEVDGREYRGGPIHPGDVHDPRDHYLHEDDARAALAAWRPGSQRAVYHDPSDPSRAALVVESSGGRGPFLVGFGGMILVIGVGYWWTSAPSRR